MSFIQRCSLFRGNISGQLFYYTECIMVDKKIFAEEAKRHMHFLLQSKSRRRVNQKKGFQTGMFANSLTFQQCLLHSAMAAISSSPSVLLPSLPLSYIPSFLPPSNSCHWPRLLKLMREMFGPQNVNWWKEDQEKISVKADQHTAILDPRSLVGVPTGTF